MYHLLQWEQGDLAVVENEDSDGYKKYGFAYGKVTKEYRNEEILLL